LNPYVLEILTTSFMVFLFIGGLLGLAVGAGLLWRAQASLLLFARLNRWVSTRRALRPFEIPHGIEVAPSDWKRRWIGGAMFAAGGLYATFVLATKVDSGRVVGTLGVSGPIAGLTGILVEALIWILIVGCAFATVAGILLAGFPRTWQAIEARANRWHSTRQLAMGGDEMHLSLDRWVEDHPRSSGVLIAALSLIPLATSAILLFGKR
jgi:hypothetical protein